MNKIGIAKDICSFKKALEIVRRQYPAIVDMWEKDFFTSVMLCNREYVESKGRKKAVGGFLNHTEIETFI